MEPTLEELLQADEELASMPMLNFDDDVESRGFEKWEFLTTLPEGL